MPITITLPDGSGFFGTGVKVHGISDLAQLANPPYHWGWQFLREEGQIPHWSSTAVNSTIFVDFTIGFNATTQEPDAFQMNKTPIPNLENTRLNMEVRDDAGAQIDTGTIAIPWNSTIGLAYTNFLLSQDVIKHTSGGSGDSAKIDQILAAVYRTWLGA